MMNGKEIVHNPQYYADEARTIYLNLANSSDRRDWKATVDHISRLGNLVMDLRNNV